MSAKVSKWQMLARVNSKPPSVASQPAQHTRAKEQCKEQRDSGARPNATQICCRANSQWLNVGA